MKSPTVRLRPFIMAVSALLALAAPSRGEDWFVKGKVYDNVRVTKVNPDTVSVVFDGCTGRLALADLPPDIAKRFVADAKRAQAFATLEKKAETDPIDHVIVSLDQNGLWMNGAFAEIRLPASATARDLVEAFAGANRAYGFAKTATILESRQVQIDPMTAPFTAVHLRTSEGEKIILFQYVADGGKGGFWRNRSFPAGY